MFKKKKNVKKKDEQQELFVLPEEDKNQKKELLFERNVRTLKDCFAPSEIRVVDASTLQVGDTYVRNYVMQGYPTYVRVGWLDNLLDYHGSLDTAIIVEPTDDRSAIEELTTQITSLQAQRDQEAKEGKTSNLISYSDRINQLEEQRRRIELNIESMFNIGIFSNLFAKSKEEIDRRAEILESELKGRRMNFLPTKYRMINGFKTALPVGENFFDDKLRNFTTGSLVACMPFIRGDICHPDGVYIGMNQHTGNNVMIDFYDKESVANTNLSVFGRAGSGKSYMVSLLTMRSALKGIYTSIIDPEGEYGHITKELGGINIDINPDSRNMINPFEIEAEAVIDEESGQPTGEYIVNLTDKYADLIDLICIMAVDVDQEQKSLISSVIVKLYQEFGITTNPASLYDKATTIDPTTGALHPNGKMKRMPQFSDFFNLLSREIESKVANDPSGFEVEPLRKMQNKLKMYCQGQAYPLFDCQSTINASLLEKVPVVNFNVSKLEESTLRPIGMYVAMNYVWEKIVKKNYQIRKRVICDEAWMFLNKAYPGHEYTSAFLEKCARRIRKRNAGLCVASQNFIEFTSSDQGNAVLNNTAVKFFLKQNETDIDALQDKFKISDGERNFLLQSKTGEVLIKTDTDVAVTTVTAFPFEHEMIVKSRVH